MIYLFVKKEMNVKGFSNLHNFKLQQLKQNVCGLFTEQSILANEQTKLSYSLQKKILFFYSRAIKRLTK